MKDAREKNFQFIVFTHNVGKTSMFVVLSNKNENSYPKLKQWFIEIQNYRLLFIT